MYLRKQLITATWVKKLDRFPSKSFIELDKPPLNNLTDDGMGVTYVNTAGTTITLSATTAYEVATAIEPGRIRLRYQQSWPTDVRDHPDVITITYKAGYGTAATDVPENYRRAIAFLVAHHYAIREPIILGSTIAQVPWTVQSLLPNRNFRFAG